MRLPIAIAHAHLRPIDLDTRQITNAKTLDVGRSHNKKWRIALRPLPLQKPPHTPTENPKADIAKLAIAAMIRRISEKVLMKHLA
jgi:hypothetical protein